MERIIDFLFGFGIAILAAFFNHLLTKDQIQKQFKNDIELMKQTVTEELMKIKDIHINEKILSTLNLLTLGYYKNDYNNSVETFFHTNEGSIQLEQISATLSVYGTNEIRAILRKLSSEMKNHITFNNYTSEITRLNNDLAIERGKGELSNDDIVGELIYDLDFYEDQLKQMNMNYDMV